MRERKRCGNGNEIGLEIGSIGLECGVYIILNQERPMCRKCASLCTIKLHFILFSQMIPFQIDCISKPFQFKTTRTFLEQTHTIRQASASPTHTDHLSRIPRLSPSPSVSTPYASNPRLRDCWHSNFYNIRREHIPPTSHGLPPRSCPPGTETEAAAGRNTIRTM